MSESCGVLPYRENHVWVNAQREAERRAAGKCAWPRCPRRIGETNHITPRLGIPLQSPGCHHHQDNLEMLCRPHHDRVTKYERRMADCLPTFCYPDDGWLPPEIMLAADVARLLDATRPVAYAFVYRYNFPVPIEGWFKGKGKRTWHRHEVLGWALAEGKLDEWDLDDRLAAMLVQDEEVAA